MKERVACEFFVIRYVPDVVKGEFINIGVILRAAERDEETAVRFTRNWSRVLCLDASADVELLDMLEAELTTKLRSRSPKPLLTVFEEGASNSLQISSARACLAESIPAEIEQLMRMYVEPMQVTRRRKVSGRTAIAASMRREFERTGVWGLMRKRIATSQYTRAGDSMRIDCGYRPNGTVRMFQAVSLESDGEAAKALAFTTPDLTAGVSRVEEATLKMTAVVEPVRSLMNDEEAVERYRFGIEAMEGAGVRVMTVTDLPRMAETARTELQV